MQHEGIIMGGDGMVNTGLNIGLHFCEEALRTRFCGNTRHFKHRCGTIAIFQREGFARLFIVHPRQPIRQGRWSAIALVNITLRHRVFSEIFHHVLFPTLKLAGGRNMLLGI